MINNLSIFDIIILLLVLYLAYKFYFEKESFEDLNPNGPTLTLYYAPECIHCHNLLKNSWKELPDEHKGVKIQKVDCTKKENEKMVNELNIEGFPTILLKKNSKEHLEYRGNRQADDILKFIEINIVGVVSNEQHHDRHEHGHQQQHHQQQGFVPNFTAYYAPWCGHSKNLLNNGWKNMPETYRGLKINKVDSTQPGNDKLIESIRDEEGAVIVRGYPTMLLELSPGKYHKYVGDRSTKHMLSFIDHQMDQNGLVKAQQINQQPGGNGFKPNFSVYYAPWCGHSVRLLKDGWAKMSDSYKGLEIRDINMMLDENKHYSDAILRPDGSRYIEGFPTILLEKTENNFIEYQGNRSYEDMINFIDKHL